tara:strand:- start:783 stop:986 length:204 start_codon:yes stop_codon:yes gene_type:complete
LQLFNGKQDLVILQLFIIENNMSRESWEFYISAKDEKIKFPYSSCNKFSSPDLLAKINEPYKLNDVG